jgi:DNA-binding beta-propeller fold protein YncE
MAGSADRDVVRTGVAASCLALAVVCVLALLPSPAMAGYKWVREWPVPSDAGGMAVGPGGVYVTQKSGAFDQQAVRRYSPEGKLLGEWGAPGTEPGQLTDPGELAVDPAGNVWVVDGFGEILVYTAEGAPVTHRTLTGPCGDELLIHDLDVDPAGELYQVFYDNCGLPDDTTRGVIRASSAFQVLSAWGDGGPDDGQFGVGGSVSSDGRGNVYVADSGNYRVQQFTSDGRFVRKWGQLGFEPGRFNGMAGIAVGPGGDVFVADRNNQRIQRFASDGTFLEQFSIPEGVEYHGLPSEIGFDAQGNLYLLGTGGYETVDEVHVFAPTGGRGGAGAAVAPGQLRYRKGRIPVKLACGGGAPCKGKLSVSKGKRRLGSVAYSLSAGKSKTVRAKVTRKGRKAIAAGRRHRVTVVLTPRGGGAPVSRTLTLRR